MKPLILASKSPRRRELLSRLGIPFEVRAPRVAEPPPAPPPGRYALWLAEQKARSAWEEGRFALGADTVVAIGELILGKPKDPEENARYLRLLSGRTHTVYTAASVVAPDGRVRWVLAAPRVRFRRLSEEEIRWYAASGEGLDKAGGYGIQERGMALVERVEGDFYAVVGLPVAGVWEVLKELGYPLLEGV